ncbi:hypothetical protein Pan153_15200 [Gimesia panareensis]|uniref:Uncharacterized protein n=1 Tax=Gimesia panareensis TaxID=2527978 RepID=A0A518FKL6_9PLAN|nr:hypothetical protein [Gimesia panareensis]QDV16886.1 hypothetical protein Pan153_15200 [Gimesia panareensis]
MRGAGTVVKGTCWGVMLLCLGTVTVQAAEPISTWEVVTTFRRPLDEDGRITLMSDGKTSKGLPWKLDGNTVDFGKEGSAKPLLNGAFYKGNWVGGWVLHARILMNNVSLKSEIVAPPVMPKTAGETMVGTRPARALNDSIVDLWEFVAILPGTNKFIRLTCDFTPNNLVLDGDRKIGTYEIDKRTVIIKFLDPQFGQVAFTEKQNNVLSGKGKPVNRKYWKLSFTRVQRMAVYRTDKNSDFIIYNNNRINSPRYTPDYYSTFYWYFDSKDGKRQLMFRSREPKMLASGRRVEWYDLKMVLVAGRPPG